MSDKATFDSAEVGRVRRNPWMLALAGSPLLLALAAVIAGITFSPAFFAVVFHPLLLAAIAFAWVWNKNPYARTVPARLHADGGGVTIDGEAPIPRSSIRDGFVLPRPGKRPIVRLSRRARPALEVEVEDEGEGRRLLRALGLDASQTAASFRVSSRALAHRSWLIAGTMATVLIAFMGRALMGAHPGAFAAFLPLTVLLMATVALIPSTLRVGVDGILLRWLGRSRFVPYADVEYVTEYREGFGRSRVYGVSLTLASGEQLKVPVSSTTWDGGRVGIIVERIHEAMATYRRGDGEADAALLRRGDRDLVDWIAALRAIGAGANAAHRIAPVAPERLWRIVEDPGAEAQARAAAAVALGVGLDDEGKSRLRVAAEATAAPKLRVALEVAADGREDDELGAALSELEAESAR